MIALSCVYASKPSTIPKDTDNRIYFAVELDPLTHKATDAKDHFKNLGDEIPSSWTFEEKISAVPNHYLFSISKNHEYSDMLFDIGHHAPSLPLSKRNPEHYRLKRRLVDNGVRSLEVFTPRQLHKRALVPPAGVKLDSSVQKIYDLAAEFEIDDPIFPEQWHLYNPIQLGHDINVTGSWAQNITGHDVKVCVIDDGLDYENKDLADNFFADGSWDFNDPGPLPKPRLSDDRHGTRCAGEIAAVKNDACGLGVAYNAKVAGVRILSKRILPSDEALAINFAMDKNDIYSCSWGPSDNGQTMEAPPEIVKKAILNAVQNGRDAKGNIYVFASGNGGSLEDNCNFDGYTNSIYSITVAAIDRKGNHPAYSESCSANMVVTYSSGSGDYIHTTDVGTACAKTHGGTSAAAPIAAGIFSLVLEANPNLTWRDMQYLAWETAVQVNQEPGWQLTPSGKMFHHFYGYGKLDSYAIVERAKTWENVKPQTWLFLPPSTENAFIPNDINTPVEFTINVTEDDLKKANVDHLEHIQVHVNADSSRRGALKMSLTSPSGIVSEIMPFRRMDASNDGVRDWNFMSVAHWGESGVGEWKLTVEHGPNPHGKTESKLVDWRLMLWGEAIDASKARVFPGMDKVDEMDEFVPIESSTTIPDEAPTTSTSISAQDGAETPASTTIFTEPTPTDSESLPTSDTEGADEEESDESESKDHSSFLGSYIPTFGMSKHTATWVYGSGLIIVIFIGGISGYLFWIRRKRLREGKDYKGFNPLMSRDGNHDEELGEELDYLHDFALTDDEDEEDDDDDGDHETALLNKKTPAYKDSNVGSASDLGVSSSQEQPGRSFGKKVFDLYTSEPLGGGSKQENSQEDSDLFQLGTDDEDNQETVAGESSSTMDSRTNSSGSDATKQ